MHRITSWANPKSRRLGAILDGTPSSPLSMANISPKS